MSDSPNGPPGKPSDHLLDNNQNLFIIRPRKDTLRAAELFLVSRGFHVESSMDVRQAIEAIKASKPRFVLFAADHPGFKPMALLRLFKDTLQLKVILYADSMTKGALDLLTDMKYDMSLWPPISGPAVERMIFRIQRLEAAQGDTHAAPAAFGHGNLVIKGSAAKPTELTTLERDLSGRAFSMVQEGYRGKEHSAVSGTPDADRLEAKQAGATLEDESYRDRKPNAEGGEPSHDRTPNAEGGEPLHDRTPNAECGEPLHDRKPNANGGNIQPGRKPGADVENKQPSRKPRVEGENEPEAHKAPSAKEQVSAKQSAAPGSSDVPAVPAPEAKIGKLQAVPDARENVIHVRGAPEEEQSLIALSAEHALDALTVQTVSGGVVEKMTTSSSISCIAVESPKFAGYILAAFGENRTIDETFMELVRSRLVAFMQSRGESFSAQEALRLKLMEVEFEPWAIEQAEFLRKSLHNGKEIALAFFPSAAEEVIVEKSKSDEMVSVRVADLQAGATLEFDLHLYFPLNNKYVKYVGTGKELEKRHIDKLKANGVDKLHLPKSSLTDLRKYKAQNYLNKQIDTFKKNPATKKKPAA